MNSPEQNFDPNVLSKLAETQEFLNRLPIFSGAPSGVAKMFAYLAKKEEYIKGQDIITGGSRCDRFFLILSGEVDIYQIYNERRFHLQLLCADSFNYFVTFPISSSSTCTAWGFVRAPAPFFVLKAAPSNVGEPE